MSLDIKQKINEFLAKRPEYALYKESELLSIMQDLGVISAKDVEQAKSTSTFGYGFKDSASKYGLSVEKTSDIKTPFKLEEKSLPQKREISTKEKHVARSYVAQILFQQALQLYDLYWQTATNRSFGNEGMMELQEVGAFVVEGLDLGKIGIPTPDTRDEIYKIVNQFINDCIKMTNCSEEKFESLFEFYCGKEFDYNNVIEYIESSTAFATASDSEKLNPESKVVKDLKAKDKNFQQLMRTNISKRIEEWSGNTLNYGGLVSLGFDMALLYGTGIFGAISKASMFTGEAMQTAMQTALKNIGMKKSVAPVIEEMAKITASQLSGAALSSTAFQTTKVVDVLADGKVSQEEGAMLSESAIGLFKFGYVGSAISGPLGAQVAQLTSKLLNSKPVINQVLKSIITNKPMPLTNVLKGLSEHSNAVSAITNFGTSFSINAGYMAMADGMSYGEALESLAQMDAVSKMVAAFMGGKNTAFLTPQKVQQVKTELAGMKVNLTVYKGQKVFSITDKEGKVTHLVNEQELMMFIVDKIATESGVGVNAGVEVNKNSVNTHQSSIKEEMQPVIIKTEAPLPDAEYAILREKVAKKIKTLPKNEQAIWESNFKREDLIHKKNIRLFDKMLSDKKLCSNRVILNLVVDVKNCYQEKLLEFWMDNYDVINRNKSLNCHDYRILCKADSQENLEFTLGLLQKVLNNKKYLENPHIGEIIQKAKSIEEFDLAIKTQEMYMIAPSKIEELTTQYGEKITNGILDGLSYIKQSFNLNVENLLLTNDVLNKDPFIILYDYKADIYVRFDKKTGELISIADKTVNFNLKNNTITTSDSQNIYKDKEAILDTDEKLLGEKVSQHNSDGTILQTLFKKSKIQGEFELYEIAADGKKYKIGLAEFDKNGGRHVEKHLTSLDGTVTDFVYADDKSGNRYIYQKITDKNGVVLSETSNTFRILEENHFETSTNGRFYDIIWTDAKVVVTKLNENKEKTNEVVEYTIREFSPKELKRINFYMNNLPDTEKKTRKNYNARISEKLIEAGLIQENVVDKALIKSLKMLSGEEWFKIREAKVQAILSSSVKDGGTSYGGMIEAEPSKSAVSSFITILHELGHEKYDARKLSEDKTLKEIYEKEKEALVASLPNIEAQQVEYFLQYLEEGGAEANYIHQIYQGWAEGYSRTMFLQRYMPKTMAYVLNKYVEPAKPDSRTGNNRTHNLQEASTVAPFAERVLRAPQIGEIIETGKPIVLENGTFNEKGEFVSDGTKTKTTNTPFAKKKAIKETPMGKFAIAETRSEMKEQLSRFLRTNGQRVDKNTLNSKLSDIDYLLKQKPGLTYADISEILINWNIIRLGHGCSDAFGYNGISSYNVADFNVLKENLSFLANKISKSIGTISDEKIEGKLTKLRSEYLAKELSKIEPKEFQKNLDTLLALDSDLQFGLTRYNYNILFKTHEESYFNNLRIMNEYNKFINEYNKENGTKYETLYNSVEYLAKRDSKELTSNVEIAKKMLEDKIPEHIIDDVVPENTTIYVDLYKQLKIDLATKPNIIKDVLPELRCRDEATRKTIVEAFKLLPEEYINAIHSSRDAYKFYNNIEASGEKGQKAFLLRAKMLTKLPKLIDRYGLQNKINDYKLINFLTEFKHPNLEKCLEFIELAEPNYLSEISRSINNYLPQDLDIYIANAKLHQELPKEFREFINREDSRTSFQYDIEPETLKQRVEKINKFNGQFVPEVLKRIYNGSLNVNDNVLATFSKMEARLVVQMLSTNLKFEHWNNLQQKTLDRIAEAFKSVDHKKCENWTLKTNLASEKLTEFFTKLTDEELNILNPQDIFSKLEPFDIRIDRLQKQIALMPEKLRPFIKDGNSTNLFYGGIFLELEGSQNKIKELEALSIEDLESLGGHIVVEYLRSYSNKHLNPKNLAIWQKVPQEIKDYLKEYGIDFITSKETIDVELLRSRFESLKKTNAQKVLNAENLIKIQNLPQETFDFMQKIFSNEKFSIAESGNYLVRMLNNMHSSEVFLFFDKLLKNPKFDINYTPSFIESFSENSELRAKQEKYIEALLTRDELSNFEISNLISTFVNYRNQNYLQTADLRFDYINKLLNRKDISANEVTSIMRGVSINDKASLIKIIKAFDVILEKENLNTQYLANLMATINSKFEDLTNKEELLVLVNNLAKDKEFSPYDIYEILESVSDRTLSFINKISTSSDKVLPRHQMVPFVKTLSEKLYFSEDERVLNFIEELTFNEKFPSERKLNIVECLNIDNLDLATKLISDKDFPKEKISDILRACQNSATKIDYAFQLCNDYKQMELSIKQVEFLIQNHGNIKVKQLKKLNRVLGSQKTNSLNEADLVIACQMVDIYGKNSINEIPQEGKKDLLRALVKCNNGLFYVSEEIKKMFPLIPTNQEAYCSLLPALVRSMGIETNTLSAMQVKDFNKSLNSLSERLSKISDSDFAALKITQEYSKEEFTRNVLNIVKDLSSTERQKVYDYFGFELHRNKTNETGFSIKGYPVNLNNGKKLAEITNLKTKEIVELLRPEVIKFSEQNPIKCNNSDVEKLLNEIVTVLPELRTQIGKSQHKTHAYDVLQHSLKVMQKISQDPQFKYLNESDKKIMMLASLLHDVTKLEGSVDKTHANESSFDTFFIAKKFNLTREEEIKLYTLTKHHEWLEYVNTSKNQQELTKRLQSVAYDLQNDNLFEMALMFTHADLRAVKADNSFHDTKLGNGRIAFDGTVRSFGESADVYAKQIKLYAQELQKSQPLLPVTPIPSASRVNEAITYVNSDGSTNIKGVYKNSDGLIVIKYNEVENWEAIGFPKGSSSKGIKAKGLNGKGVETDVETGNIKFFAHGLDYENQMSKFDAFSLVDSDVLLSISYAERPESKYRFFRPQGLLLNFDTKYIHGGGNTDSGSGCGKSISDFKKRYILGGERESDRLYVSNLIKEATGMNDTEYVKFVKNNENKPFSEIEPIEIRTKIIQIFATINSNVRKGNREYNEMYGSNPKEVMAPFTYNTNSNEKVGNPIEFLNKESVHKRTSFLKEYALKNDKVFIVFGD